MKCSYSISTYLAYKNHRPADMTAECPFDLAVNIESPKPGKSGLNAPRLESIL